VVVGHEIILEVACTGAPVTFRGGAGALKRRLPVVSVLVQLPPEFGRLAERWRSIAHSEKLRLVDGLLEEALERGVV
jgi:hypothetical protein